MMDMRPQSTENHLRRGNGMAYSLTTWATGALSRITATILCLRPLKFNISPLPPCALKLCNKLVYQIPRPMQFGFRHPCWLPIHTIVDFAVFHFLADDIANFPFTGSVCGYATWPSLFHVAGSKCTNVDFDKVGKSILKWDCTGCQIGRCACCEVAQEKSLMIEVFNDC